MHRKACSPQCIEDLIESFYQPDSWAIAAQSFSHMNDTLAIKTQQLILMESDHGLLIWLQEWKREVIDKEDGTKFILWEEE